MALNALSQPETLFRTDDTFLLFTVTCCSLCRDSYWSHTFCAQLLLYKVFSACFVSRLTGRGKPAFFMSRTRILLQAKPILSYNSIVFTPSLVQHHSPDKSLLVTDKVGNLHSWNATKHSIIVEVTIAHLCCPFFSPLSKQSCTQRHLYFVQFRLFIFTEGWVLRCSLAMQHSLKKGTRHLAFFFSF